MTARICRPTSPGRFFTTHLDVEVHGASTREQTAQNVPLGIRQASLELRLSLDDLAADSAHGPDPRRSRPSPRNPLPWPDDVNLQLGSDRSGTLAAAPDSKHPIRSRRVRLDFPQLLRGRESL